MMTDKDKMLDELARLVETDKFSDEEWHKRGLYPSDSDVIKYMSDRLDLCIAELVLASDKSLKKRKLKSILKRGLRRYKRFDLDTEEAEFIADYFELLSKITGVKFADPIMLWLYGPVVFSLWKIMRIIRPERILAAKKQACTKCSTLIEVHLLRKGSSRNSEWVIGQCNSCNEYNLLESFANARRTSYINFSPNEYLSKEEFTAEKAIIRLEQIRIFRK